MPASSRSRAWYYTGDLIKFFFFFNLNHGWYHLAKCSLPWKKWSHPVIVVTLLRHCSSMWRLLILIPMLLFGNKSDSYCSRFCFLLGSFLYRVFLLWGELIPTSCGTFFVFLIILFCGNKIYRYQKKRKKKSPTLIGSHLIEYKRRIKYGGRG